MAETTTFKDRALQVLAILGLVAILLIGAWGIIQIAFSLPNVFTNFGGAPSLTTKQEKLSVTLPSTVTSGQPFTLSWSHQNGTGNYSYAVSYSCAAGLSLKAPLPTGATQTVPCNTPFNFTNASNGLTLTPELTGKSQVGATFTVVSNNLQTGAITSSASSTTTVLPAASATTPANNSTSAYGSAGQPSSTYVPATTHRTTLYGSPDLSVQILSAPAPVGGRYSVQFVIQNVGTNVAHSGWTFNAALPLSPAYTYQSQPQQALYPGDKIVYTLGFGNDNTYNSGCGAYQYPYSGTYTMPCAYPSYGTSSLFSVTADPQGALPDTNRNNNTASLSLPLY